MVRDNKRLIKRPAWEAGRFEGGGMLLYFGSKSMMPAASSLVCESAHTCSTFAQAT